MAQKNIEIPKESCALRLKKALSIRNMTQAELCQKTKIPKSALSEYIKGLYEPKQDRLIILSEALDVDPVWLMGFDIPMEKEDKKISPHEPTLTEGEKVVLDLFRQIPVDQQPMVLAMIRAALCTDK
jgi:transcriptional regulator with XRE-family HTH domain